MHGVLTTILKCRSHDSVSRLKGLNKKISRTIYDIALRYSL
jgi:hypothetical protein